MAGFPTCGEHRGIPLYAGQSERSLRRARSDIDTVLSATNVEELARIVQDDTRYACEARKLAFHKLEAMWQAATAAREQRPPNIHLQELAAFVSHVGTSWMPLQEPSWPPVVDDDEDDPA